VSKYTYSFEVLLDDKWFRPFGMADTQLGFLRGYAMGRNDTAAPRLAMRVIRSDGRVMDEYAAATEVNIGLIAGWPTPEQYEEAAKRALATAGRIREANKRRERT